MFWMVTWSEAVGWEGLGGGRPCKEFFSIDGPSDAEIPRPVLCFSFLFLLRVMKAKPTSARRLKSLHEVEFYEADNAMRCGFLVVDQENRIKHAKGMPTSACQDMKKRNLNGYCKKGGHGEALLAQEVYHLVYIKQAKANAVARWDKARIAFNEEVVRFLLYGIN